MRKHRFSISNLADSRLNGFGCRHMLAVAVVILFSATAPSAADPSLFAALKSGQHVALLRHALAPGTGDPEDFSLRDCATQRNLSPAGRKQAERIGERLRGHGIETAAIYSSQWCRCLETAKLLGLETAKLLGLGPVEEWPVLNSFFRRFERRDEQTAALAAWLAARNSDVPAILVTHQVNITALTGIFPASGELVIVRRAKDGALSVAGTLKTD